MKLVFADPKSGFVFQKEVEGAKERQLVGKKIGDKADGAIAGLEGYELQITGGTDKSGFPMRRDISGVQRVKALLSGGAGIRGIHRGQRENRQVVGGTVNENIAQVNAKITTYGAKPLSDFGFVPLSQEERKKKKEEKAAAKAAPKARKK
jgi:small subunit ribosomal protein S6e